MLGKKYLINVCFIGVIVFAILGNFGRVMTSFNHNEHMYITTGVLVSQNKVLYKDFAYLQMPYLPLFYSGVYKIFGLNTFYFFIGKLISFLALMVSASILFLFARQVSKDENFSLGITGLYLLNTSIIIPASEVSNYVLPVVFSFIAIYLYEISLRRNTRKVFLLALSGLFIGLAFGTKLTYASIGFPFVLTFFITFLMNRHQKSALKEWLLKTIIPWSLGLFLGLLPVLFFYWMDPEAFIFNNLGYHQLNTQWRVITGFTYNMTSASKVAFGWEIITNPDNLVILCGVFLGILISRHIHNQIPNFDVRLILAFTLFLIGLLTAVTPTPSFSQYYAMPVSFLFICFVYAWGDHDSNENSLRYRRALLLGLVLVTLIFNGLFFISNIAGMRDIKNWSPIYIRDISLKIREILRENQSDQNPKIGTLSPLFAVESGLYVYEELSTGPFLYRVGDLLTPEQRKRFVGSSPSTIDDLFESDPPAAILIGFEGDLDQPLLEYALANKFRKINLTAFKGELYIRP